MADEANRLLDKLEAELKAAKKTIQSLLRRNVHVEYILDSMRETIGTLGVRIEIMKPPLLADNINLANAYQQTLREEPLVIRSEEEIHAEINAKEAAREAEEKRLAEERNVISHQSQIPAAQGNPSRPTRKRRRVRRDYNVNSLNFNPTPTVPAPLPPPPPPRPLGPPEYDQVYWSFGNSPPPPSPPSPPQIQRSRGGRRRSRK